MIYIPEPFDKARYTNQAPIDSVSMMVTAAWLLMFPKKGKPKYDAAYSINMGAYIAGHPEGASNIGLLILREKLSDKLFEVVVGQHDSTDVAQAWFLKAMESPFHSPQAEVEMAKIVAYRPFGSDSRALASEYLTLAFENANNPYSLWLDEKDSWLQEIESAKREIDEFLAKREVRTKTIN